MGKKQSMMTGLGDVYGKYSTGYTNLSFVYKNITDFQSYLSQGQWQVNISITDEAATKANIIAKFTEVLSNLEEDDWLIFYYTGHGAQYDPGTGLSGIKTYCVTYSPDLRYNFFPGINSFLSEDDYAALVGLFGERVPKGHLITILDCCNAEGIVDTFVAQQPYHTLIAATSKYTSAYYDTNSAFFTAFNQVWNEPFDQLQDAINQKLNILGAPNTCIVKAAPNFQTLTL